MIQKENKKNQKMFIVADLVSLIVIDVIDTLLRIGMKCKMQQVRMVFYRSEEYANMLHEN